MTLKIYQIGKTNPRDPGMIGTERMVIAADARAAFLAFLDAHPFAETSSDTSSLFIRQVPEHDILDPSNVLSAPTESRFDWRSAIVPDAPKAETPDGEPPKAKPTRQLFPDEPFIDGRIRMSDLLFWATETWKDQDSRLTFIHTVGKPFAARAREGLVFSPSEVWTHAKDFLPTFSHHSVSGDERVECLQRLLRDWSVVPDPAASVENVEKNSAGSPTHKG